MVSRVREKSPFKIVSTLSVNIHTHIWGVVEHLIILAGLIQSQLSCHGDVRQLLLHTEDVATHFLNTILINASDVHHRAHQDVGNEWTKTLKDVLQSERI